ncbi:MAG: universal stress protein [Planctomycetes bacterium]|nr:universal stress protein [Planctomycetota bacterium]
MTAPLQLSYLLVPVDFSAPSLAALEYARGLAARCGARVELLHVIDAAAVDGVLGHASPAVWAQALEDARRRLKELAQGEPCKVLEGRPADVVVDHAQAVQADMIVMGSLGRTGLERLLIGSVAERVVRMAPCPVLVLREGMARKA